MTLVIGIVGEIGAGKGTISEHLHKKYHANRHRFSDILKDLLDRLYLPDERLNLQRLGVSIRRALGKDTIVNAFKKDLERIEGGIIVIDGIRYWNEVEMLRNFENNLLLYVTAPQKVRYERCKKRGERGEGNMTFEEFLRSERRKTERYIKEIGKKADYIIENAGTIEELKGKVDEMMKKIMK